ncbi:hypothetical protein DL766_002399 [Monosporascus sp. MC13-8B]|uniref:Alpha/beta hydrolase fold-3 domain-containing protein n=1 Tax=Monosporascus cannonballus TaxID=155416 RepID=A0ABY0HH72_9PEZI|nr:hypothetical protein DL762_001980 [Monosporascus cannonballus]RYO97104.1 hypothetical protein DL763_002894 [Monosporascus cannonballus]RYP35666.1 hypothetical protein DL766_002399 [Monosporascus sp. MC13-8B]
MVKTYECRPTLPIRIFFPAQNDRSTAQALPTLFMIHGGGFTVGSANNDDEWNAGFARMHDVLVIELNYRKAPYQSFPTATYDVEALLLAALDDESLPIDRARVAVGGFSAGGNLTLSVCQLASVRDRVKPSAALPLYPVVDFTVPLAAKVKTRPYKPGLGSGRRSEGKDYLSTMSPYFNWAYVPVGQDLRDPLLSPYFAPREALPPHLFLLGIELDQLAHEGWRMASKLAGRPVPALEDKVGREEPAAEGGDPLILDDERFAFRHVEEGGHRSVQWLLVPDQIHGFDHLPLSLHGSEEAMKDARVKTAASQKLLGEWLFDLPWKQ